MRNPTPQRLDAAGAWWKPEREGGASILAAMLGRARRSARLSGDSGGRRCSIVEMCWADYYARAYGVPLEFVQAVIDVESAWHPVRDFHEGRGGDHAAHAAHRVHLRRDQSLSDRGEHSRRGCIPCVFDSAVRRRAPACGSRLLCRRAANQEAGAQVRRRGHLSLRVPRSNGSIESGRWSRRPAAANPTKGAEHP